MTISAARVGVLSFMANIMTVEDVAQRAFSAGR
jgi:hypothetical protein